MLISPAYQALQRQLHEEREDYGSGLADVWQIMPAVINDVIAKFKIEHLLDYGHGKGHLFEVLKATHKMRLQAYDPGIERLSEAPEPAQMVCCIDVLEHIEPDCLEDVLDHLEELTQTVGIFSVHTGPAGKTLADGRNAHLIQKPVEWWLPRLWDRFKIRVLQDFGTGFFAIVVPLADKDIGLGSDHELQHPGNGGPELPGS